MPVCIMRKSHDPCFKAAWQDNAIFSLKYTYNNAKAAATTSTVSASCLFLF
ncbi:hypothetical protein ACSS6W_007654 [Trichoderma asperelloides]